MTDHQQGQVNFGALIKLLASASFLFFTGCSSVYMKGTPLYTGEYSKPQAPPEERVNLWPLMYHHEPVTSILWPAGEITDDHIAARPAFSVYKLDHARHEYNIAWPLAEFDFDDGDHHILPFFWGSGYFIIFPEVWFCDDVMVILPFACWNGGFCVFPLVWYEEDEWNHFFPLWLHAKYSNGQHDTSLLWPVFNVKNKPNTKGHRVWPLYGTYKSSYSNDRYNNSYKFALWPLCHEYKGSYGNALTRIAAPLYFQYRYENDEWKIVPGLLYQRKKDDQTMTLSPFWAEGGSNGSKWQALLPFYYYSNDTETKTSRILTPLIGKTTSPDRTRWFLLPLSSSVAWGDGDKDLWFIAPLARVKWAKQLVTAYFFPFCGYFADEKLFLSAIFSRQNKENEGFVNLGGILYHYSRDHDTRRIRVLPPFSGFKWGDGNNQSYVFPLYAYDRNEKMVLTPLVSWQKKKNNGFLNLGGFLAHYDKYSDKSRGFYLFPPFTGVKWQKGKGITHTRLIPLFSWSKYGDRRKIWIAPWIYSVRSPNYTKLGCPPLWGYRRYKRTTRGKSEEDTDASLLFWLFDYKKRSKENSDEEYVRSRVLWRMMHYERVNDHTTLDMFPFITYDRKKSEGFRKFSFAWRLINYERKRDGGLNMDLLFLPVCRSGGK